MEISSPICFKKFFLVFVLLNIIDACTTVNIILLGGVELNYIPALVISEFGLIGFFWFKYIGSILLGLLCLKWAEVRSFLLLTFSVICCWNSASILILINAL